MHQNTAARNTLGIWAFVFSLTGVSCLPVLGSIVGLVLGIMAVRREPRGLSIAAIVISTIGGCLVPLVAAPFAILLPALAKARTSVARLQFGAEVGAAVDMFHTKKGRLPVDLAEAYGGQSFVPLDEWGTPVKLVLVEPDGSPKREGADARFVNFAITSAGRDKQWDTVDDASLYEGMIFKHGSGGASDASESDESMDGAEDGDGDGGGDGDAPR